jgi:hypothetical protein
MTDEATTSGTEQAAGPQRLLPLLLAMAMFVLVVDTSLMNVSIASGLFNSFRMMRLPDPEPSGSAEGKALG